MILDSKYSLYYPKLSHEETADEVKKVRLQISKLKDSLLYLSYDISDIQDEINVYTEAKNILKTNGVMRSQGKVNDSIVLLKEALELYTFKMNQLNKKLSGLRKTKNAKMKIDKRMNERLNRLKNHLGSIGNQNNNNKPIPRITVTLSANTSTSGNISFSYLASGAGWSPLYDIRSESSQGKIFMNYKAEVYQNTGLDWKKIKLNISTNNPYANKTKPELNPWYLSYIQYKKEYESARDYRGNKNIYNLNAAPTEAITNKGFYMADEIAEEQPALSANQFTNVVQKLISAEFKIDLPTILPQMVKNTWFLFKIQNYRRISSITVFRKWIKMFT